MRKAIAVVLGAITGSIVLLLVGMIANVIQPTPPELMDPATPDAVALRVASAPLFTWLSTIFGLSLGAFIGGAIGARAVLEKPVLITSAIGLALAPWAFYTFYIVFPAVLWVPISMLIAVFLFSYLGGVVAMRNQ